LKTAVLFPVVLCTILAAFSEKSSFATVVRFINMTIHLDLKKN